MSMPALSTFSSGFPIPLKIDISCPGSPALPKILCPLLEVVLLRRVVAVVDSKQIPGSRDFVLCSGSLVESTTPQEGTTVSHFEVMVGDPGHEQSWRVEDILEVSVRLCPSSITGGNSNHISVYPFSLIPSPISVYPLGIDNTAREHEIFAPISYRRGHQCRQRAVGYSGARDATSGRHIRACCRLEWRT